MQLTSVITSLPLDPGQVKNAGFLSLFVKMYNRSRATRVKSIYSTNIIGKNGSSELDTETLRNTIKTLGITPSAWWHDGVCMNVGTVAKILDQLIQDKRVTIEEVLIRRCLCGRIEHLAHVPLRGGRKSLIKDGSATCCGSALFEEKTPALLTCGLPKIEKPTVEPTWLNKELWPLITNLLGMRILLSRSSLRPLTYNGLSLDTDVVSYFYASALAMRGYVIEELVVGPTILQRVAMTLLVANLCGAPEIKRISCVPKVKVTDGRSGSECTTDELLSDVPQALEMLARAGNSSKKTITAQMFT